MAQQRRRSRGRGGRNGGERASDEESPVIETERELIVIARPEVGLRVTRGRGVASIAA